MKPDRRAYLTQTRPLLLTRIANGQILPTTNATNFSRTNFGAAAFIGAI